MPSEAYCIRKDLRSPYIVFRAPWKGTEKAGRKNIFPNTRENGCKEGLPVHNNSRSYQTMCARGGIGRRARFRF